MSRSLPLFLCIIIINFIAIANCKVYDIEDEGAISGNSSISACTQNTHIFNQTLLSLKPGDTLLVPKGKIFWFIGGIYASYLTDITIQIDGSIYYTDDEKAWPKDDSGHVKECMLFEHMKGVTFTSSNGKEEKGLIYGNGKKWWGAVKYLIDQENRPRLLTMYNVTDILIEYIYFKDSPYWNVYLNDVKNVEIQWSNVSARVTNIDYHDLDDLTAFNTDGFDVAGSNVYIHDCEIWNDDDCIAVKRVDSHSINGDCARDMLFERLNASGLGLTIGSIGPSKYHTCVDNVTFRDINMYKTVKGVYVKSDPGSANETGQITNVLYENIYMEEPDQYAIWIGPQQAIYGGCCDITWPENPLAECPVPPEVTFANITLRNITINNPRESPGVILGNSTNPMRNILFDGVFVSDPKDKPFEKYYACDGVLNATAIHTVPIPPCFNQ